MVYGMEAVLPIEMCVRSLKRVLESEILKANWLQSKYDQLCMLDEKRLKALYHIQGYQRWLKKAFDKKVRTRDLNLGGLSVKRNPSPGSRCKWEVQVKLGWPIHYQTDIL